MKNNAIITLFAAVVTLGLASCRTDRTPPTLDDLFALVPEKTENVAGINIDSCSFVATFVPDAVLPYVNHSVAVLFTLPDADMRPVLVMRATDPVALGQAAYDWMQAPIDGTDGQHLLSMYTNGNVTTFTDSRFAWFVPSDGAKETMKALLNAKGGYKTAEALRLTLDGALRDAASGRVTIDGTQVPLVAHTGAKTLQVLSGTYALTDTAAIANDRLPGITANVSGLTAMAIMQRLTSGLSLAQQLAVNTVLPYVERAKEVEIKALPDMGITVTMLYDSKVADASEVENSLAKLAASAGYHGMVETTPDNGVTLGPIEVAFDTQAVINLVQDLKAPATQPSFALDITVPGSLADLLSTPPFSGF